MLSQINRKIAVKGYFAVILIALILRLIAVKKCCRHKKKGIAFISEKMFSY